MDSESTLGRKNKRRKRYVEHHGVIEKCLYYNLKNDSHYDILVSMRIDGKPVQRSKENIKSITLARNIRDKFIKELENLKNESLKGDILWSTAVKQYFKHMESLMNIGELAFSTYDNRVNSITHNTKSWGNKKLSEIHTEFIRESLNINITAESHDTKKSILKYIRQVFSHQILRGNKSLYFNPASGIKFKRTEKNPDKYKTMSIDEVQKLIEYTEEIKSPWAAVYFLAFQLGCRSGELYALKWSNIDWIKNEITVKSSYCWRLEQEKPTKNYKPRTIPINPHVVDYLKNLQSSNQAEDIYILPRIPAWKSGRAAEILRDTQGRLKITKTTFHGIRSSFITHLLTINTAPIQVMDLVGHADLKTLMVYVKKIEGSLKGTTDKLGFDPKKKKNEINEVVVFPQKIPKKDIAS